MTLYQRINYQLSTASLSWPLVICSCLTGFICALAIVMMRLIYENIQYFFTLDQYDSLQPEHQELRALAPVIGALIIVLLALVSRQKYQRMGIPYVLHRYQKYMGSIPIGNTINQFFSAIAALASGFSVGKEGPAVHVGAGSASFLSHKLTIPHNARRLMTACGMAAGIAATFNAPLAAVIFVLEVILRQWRLYQLLPLTLAALIGSSLSQFVFTNVHEYAQLPLKNLALYDMGPLIILGIVVGLAAALFNRSLMLIMQASSTIPMYIRLPLAGGITGLIAWYIPAIIGTDSAALTVAFSEQPQLSFIILVLIGKWIATICALGLGIPGGVIGVLYALGALLGATITWAVIPFFPLLADYSSMIIIICMVALMAASLHAPLAALVAIVEMSQQTQIIFPSLVVVVSALLISHKLLGIKSLFSSQLDFQQSEYKNNHIFNVLCHSGALTLVRRKYKISVQLPLPVQLSIPCFFQPEPNKLVFLNASTTSPLSTLDYRVSLAEVYQELLVTDTEYVMIADLKSQQLMGFISLKSIQKFLHKNTQFF